MILVLVETDASGAVEVSREALTFARDLSSAGGGVPVDAVVVGPVPPGLREQLEAYAVRTVHKADGEGFAAFSGAAWAAAVQAAREAAGSVVVTAAGTPRGNEVLAHVAARLGVAMAANVLSFGGLSPFVVTRQVVGGAALEEMRLDERPAVFTVAGHAVEASPAPSPGPADVVECRPMLSEADLVARVVSTDEPEPDLSGSLKSARVVVGAGRGAGSADGFADLLELTDLLGASLGVSRVVTSLGWRPHHEQVGQTGSRISPDLYIPCGISGAIQHWAGCATAKNILAINTDPDAPMVTKATHAVIGDLHEVVPAINAEIRRRRGA
ncbi:electron transfer flavoprotein subunit alpha/FixB family protein [Nocardioides ungokensis]|uniref:electron transfer flavoprotein subunit alpha/FixB family protein n=1 Tax=Nocardioides ungokensis TaxID=1643322 RepID=UPI0015DD5764|nr:electron transfer flavoprotein subunit alpha/FixB family protein [Nocardioides ungokensis]